MRSPRFEPGSSAWQGVVDWNRFREWIEAKNYRGSYPSTMFNYAQRYAECLFSKDLSALAEFSEAKRPQVLKALSCLSKFLGVYEEYKVLVKNYGLKWVGRNAEDLIIDRLNKTSDPEEIFQWIRNVKEARPELCEFMDFMAVTGLRLIEAFHSYNLIIKLTREKALSEKYYNIESGFLEHFRFKEIFIRSSKKAFVSYVPIGIIEAIGKKAPFKAVYSIRKRLVNRHIQQRFSDVRENHGSFVTEWLRPEEIDFLHGRLSSSVFLKHYYNPNLVSDLRSRVAKACLAILAKTTIKNEAYVETQKV